MTEPQKQVEYFNVSQEIDIMETILWSLESIIYIVGAFFAGFQFHATSSLWYLLMFLIIIIIRFVWKRTEKITKQVEI
jgi:hypothetical protein